MPPQRRTVRNCLSQTSRGHAVNKRLWLSTAACSFETAVLARRPLSPSNFSRTGITSLPNDRVDCGSDMAAGARGPRGDWLPLTDLSRSSHRHLLTSQEIWSPDCESTPRALTESGDGSPPTIHRERIVVSIAPMLFCATAELPATTPPKSAAQLKSEF